MNKETHTNTQAQQFVVYLESDLDGVFEEARFDTEDEAKAYVTEHKQWADYYCYAIGHMPADGFEAYADEMTEYLAGW